MMRIQANDPYEIRRQASEFLDEMIDDSHGDFKTFMRFSNTVAKLFEPIDRIGVVDYFVEMWGKMNKSKRASRLEAAR